MSVPIILVKMAGHVLLGSEELYVYALLDLKVNTAMKHTVQFVFADTRVCAVLKMGNIFALVEKDTQEP